YRWLVQKYAKKDDKILDTHVGSASSLIAFEEAGLEYVAREKDKQIYQSALARLEEYKSQIKLF
ncbi:TPA: site-specific DNA-methyltransferase, partial [Streptococcus suis]|nr:site-specific DNA-methyltransferase [Streptococcus suis]